MIQIVRRAGVCMHVSVQSWREFQAVLSNQSASPFDRLTYILFHASLDPVAVPLVDIIGSIISSHREF
jgi:hypothetical protein